MAEIAHHDKYVRLALSSPILVAFFLIILYYLGGPELRRVLDFLTFSSPLSR